MSLGCILRRMISGSADTPSSSAITSPMLRVKAVPGYSPKGLQILGGSPPSSSSTPKYTTVKIYAVIVKTPRIPVFDFGRHLQQRAGSRCYKRPSCFNPCVCVADQVCACSISYLSGSQLVTGQAQMNPSAINMPSIATAVRKKRPVKTKQRLNFKTSIVQPVLLRQRVRLTERARSPQSSHRDRRRPSFRVSAPDPRSGPSTSPELRQPSRAPFHPAREEKPKKHERTAKTSETRRCAYLRFNWSHALLLACTGVSEEGARSVCVVIAHCLIAQLPNRATPKVTSNHGRHFRCGNNLPVVSSASIVRL